MLLIDDLLLRSLGISLGPLDIFYLLEIVADYAKGLHAENQLKILRNRLKENRLNYELGEITDSEYRKVNDEMSKKIRAFERVSNVNLQERMSILA